MILRRCPQAVARLPIVTGRRTLVQQVQVEAKEQNEVKAAGSSLRTALASLPKTQYKLHVRYDIKTAALESRPNAIALFKDLPAHATISSISRLQFRSLPFTDAAYLLTGPNPGLAKAGATRSAREAAGRPGSPRPAITWSCEYFSIRAIPPLERHAPRDNRQFVPFPKPETTNSTRKFETPSKALDRLLLRDEDVPKEYRKQVKEWMESFSYKMDLTIVIPKRIAKLSTTRTRTRMRIRSAIRQIVQYGITTPGAQKGQESGVVQQKVGPAHWLLPGWTYVFHPSLEVLLLPQEILLNRMAAGLCAIKDKGIEARTLYRAEVDLELAEQQFEQSTTEASVEEGKASHPEAARP